MYNLVAHKSITKGCFSFHWGEIMSLNCGHQRAYCSSPRLYIYGIIRNSLTHYKKLVHLNGAKDGNMWHTDKHTPAWISSAGIWSEPGALYLFIFLIMTSTSAALGSAVWISVCLILPGPTEVTEVKFRERNFWASSKRCDRRNKGWRAKVVSLGWRVHESICCYCSHQS
jgi:hypothetical protein